MIDQETIQRIMDAVHIEDVIGEFVTLKKRGTNHIGCCPFHNEKTPSFVVSPAKGIYKCFGCGKAGDAVRFLMDHEHYTYPEALRYLAAKYNIHIEEEQLTEEQIERNNERDALFHVSEFAQKYFADTLYNDEMGRAVGLSYFHQRGLSDEIIKTFGLGYCIDEWSHFTDYARRNGYSDNVLEKTGLTIFKEGGKAYDRFRGRVMFPIFSISGRVLGFSGRILSKEKQVAKYVNSPDSEIYNKSRILYGLYQARTAITRADKCYLVEGNVDVVSMHQSGVCNSVASCGTSLTAEQVRLIKRYTSNVTVLYDGDAAGIKAAFRAVNMLFEEGLHVRVVLFPDGEDPDSYAQKYGSAQLQQYLAEHEENFILFKTHILLNDVKNDPIRKNEVLKEIVQTIALVPDLMERTEYVSLCASKFSMSEAALQSELAKVLNQQRRKELDRRLKELEAGQQPDVATHPEEADVPPPLEPESDEFVTAFSNPDELQERKVISLLINNGDTIVPLPIEDENGNITTDEYSVAAAVVSSVQENNITFDNPLYQRVYDRYAEGIQRGEILDGRTFVSDPDEEIRNLASTLMVETYHVSDKWQDRMVLLPSVESRLPRDVEESILILIQRKLDRLVADNAARIQQALSSQDEIDLHLSLSQKVQLDMLTHKIGSKLHRVINP